MALIILIVADIIGDNYLQFIWEALWGRQDSGEEILQWSNDEFIYFGSYESNAQSMQLEESLAI